MNDVDSDGRALSRDRKGWVLVAVQAILLFALVVMPRGDRWIVNSWLSFVWSTCFFGGLAVALGAALRLGSSLTPTPVPSAGAALKTAGPYRSVRHPIYSGLLLTVVGLVIRSASWVHVAIGVATVIFFDRKAAWEEQLLTARYPAYADYKAVTPKFIPRLWAARGR